MGLYLLDREELLMHQGEAAWDLACPRSSTEEARRCADAPDRKGEPRRFGPLGEMRQWIESIIDTLKGQLGLERYGGPTPGGLFARVAQRVLALAAGVWFNWQLDQPDNALSDLSSPMTH
jgi:hypothetical protein